MTSLPASTIKNGLETENTNTYYYENGQQLKNAFKIVNGKMYYFNSNGVMAKDYFYKNWGHTYYFQKMVLAWMTDSITIGETPTTLERVVFV